MPIRRAIGVRTILHVLGPLLNPAGVPPPRLWASTPPAWCPPVAEAMALLGTTHAMVVHGHQGWMSFPEWTERGCSGQR